MQTKHALKTYINTEINKLLVKILEICIKKSFLYKKSILGKYGCKSP